MPRFYSATPIIAEQKTLLLPNDIFQHWCIVLRGKIGDSGVLFDGTGGEWQVRLSRINKNSATAELLSFDPINRTLPYSVMLGLVLSRGERMDYAVQKATEMGVATIQLLTSQHCQAALKYQRDHKKLTHWQKIVRSSCEQCGMNKVPEILPPLPVQQWTKACSAELKLVLNFDGKPAFSSQCPKSIALLVGSEGGLTDDEIAQAQHCGFLSWCLGKRILRTETAPIAAMASLGMIFAESVATPT